MLHAMESSIASTLPSVMREPRAKLAKMFERAMSTQSATAGEKSKAEKRRKRSPRKRFKNGSQSELKKRPNPECCAPGNQVSMTRIKHKSI